MKGKMKNKIDKMVEKIGKSFQVFNKRKAAEKPVDVMALVVDLANAEKAINDNGPVCWKSRDALLAILKARGTQCLVVPTNPDGTEVFVAYIDMTYNQGYGPGIERLKLERVKVEAA